MKKTLMVLFVLVLLFAHVQNTDAHVLDISMLPKLTDIKESGQIVDAKGIRYLYNNGYIDVWFKGDTEVFQFKWTEQGWRLEKIITNVISDCCVAVKKCGVCVNENDAVTIKTNGQNIRSNKQVKNNLIKDSCLYIAPDAGMCSNVEIKSDSFYLPIIRRDVRQYVRNKKPNGVVSNSNILINGLQAMFCEPIFI